MRSVTNLFDCYIDDYLDEKFVEGMSDLDIRAQLEVSIVKTLTN